MIQRKDIDSVNQAIINLTNKPNREPSKAEWLALFTLVKELAEHQFSLETQQTPSSTQTQHPSPIMKQGRMRRT